MFEPVEPVACAYNCHQHQCCICLHCESSVFFQELQDKIHTTKMSSKMNKVQLSKGILQMKFMSRTKEKLDKEADEERGR